MHEVHAQSFQFLIDSCLVNSINTQGMEYLLVLRHQKLFMYDREVRFHIFKSETKILQLLRSRLKNSSPAPKYMKAIHAQSFRLLVDLFVMNLMLSKRNYLRKNILYVSTGKNVFQKKKKNLIL